MLLLNIQFLILLLYSVTKTISSPQKPISIFTIESFGINIPITLFEEDEYASTITRISIEAYNYCYISSNRFIPTQCVVNSSNSPKTNYSSKSNNTIFLVDDEELLKILFYSELPSILFQFKAILYPCRIASRNIHQSTITPVFLIDQKEFDLLLNMLTLSNEANVVTEDNFDFSIKIKYDNTNTLLPYDYISYSKYIPLLITTIITSMILFQLISSKCKYGINTKIFILFSFIKSLFSLFYFLWLNLLLSSNYNNGNHFASLALQSVFDVLMSIIYSIFLTVHFTFIIMCSFGLGILYPTFSRDYFQIYFLIFIILYLFISSDNLVDYIEYKLFNTLKLSEVKNIIVILSIACICLIKIKKNMNLLKQKIRYSIAYAHQYYYWLKTKHRIMQLLAIIIWCFALSYIGIVIFYNERSLSPYYDIIRKVNTINIGELFYLLSSILIISKEKVIMRYDINLINLNIDIKGNVLKCIIGKDDHNIKKKTESSNPLIVVLPGFYIHHITKHNLIDLDSLKLGNISEDA